MDIATRSRLADGTWASFQAVCDVSHRYTLLQAVDSKVYAPAIFTMKSLFCVIWLRHTRGWAHMRTLNTVSAQQLPHRPDTHMTAGIEYARTDAPLAPRHIFESYSPFVADNR
jgi:hypothetical protein